MSQSHSLEFVTQAFIAWRQQRQSRVEAIPTALRKQAVALKKQYPASHIISALKINHRMLKQWTMQFEPDNAPQFLAIPPEEDRSGETYQPMVKLTYPNGIVLTLTEGMSRDTLVSLITQLSAVANQ